LSLTAPPLACDQNHTRKNNIPQTNKQTGLFVPDKSNIWRDSCDGYLDWVKEHVADGCSLDASDACGDPPLVLACGNGHLSVAQFLLAEGASLDGARSVMGETALVRAAHNGHVDVVRFLLGRGADALAAVSLIGLAKGAGGRGR